MNGQESCEGINGQKTLLGEIRGKYCRELPEKKVNPRQVFIDMYGEDQLEFKVERCKDNKEK